MGMSARKPPPRGLVFYEKAHRYRLDGKWVPGVTTILSVIDKPGLKKWAAETVAAYVADHREAVEHLSAAGRGPMVAALKEMPWQKRDDAAERGTTLHDFAENIARGEDVDVPDELVPVVENAVRFMDEWHIEPVLIEACVASREHQYGGKLDLIARYRHPRTGERGVGIFDWKSGKRIYCSVAWQNAAYGHAEFHGQNGDEHPLPAIDASFGVHIRPDDFDVHPVPYDPDIFAEFLAIRRVFDINKRAEGNWREPGTGYVGVAVQPTDPWEEAS
jgi:hypothetical protein